MISDAMSLSYHDVMEVYKRPMSVRYIPNIFASLIILFISFFATPVNANHLPVMYVQVPQWADDWAVCAVDIPDAKCHWYVMAPDNTFGEGFSWEDAPWFDANGLNDVAPMQATSVVQQLQNKQ
tara:strand:- start:114 stop:485 length:372 start_codon:yes stop_codon:yes gene_type:complete